VGPRLEQILGAQTFRTGGVALVSRRNVILLDHFKDASGISRRGEPARLWVDPHFDDAGRAR
jgi:hypothetical protein